ncbi:ATP-dependent nuclease [Xylanibacter oryzae]|uniref:ATP-dependent nuclease n=1 Tax=Xylanibacter oryzae TaxID=185293 RepID=UPI0004B2B7AF|nr:AAA family ATPase [Xylanibacter oryzae]
MQLTKVYIKGFRNFKEATVNFNKHCLVIGANDVGKTNLIYALRILLDRGFSDYDFELNESDFFAYEETKNITIRAYFEDVTEDCIVAKMRGKISNEGNLVLQYTATIDNGKVCYQFYCGKSESEDDLKEIDGPYYRKYLNIKYISSRREFWSYINKTKTELLKQAKDRRTAEIVSADEQLYSEIENELQNVDTKIPQLSYVKNATEKINKELNKLSIHNSEQQVVFDTASTDIDKVISNVSLTSKNGDKKLVIGGEGRINQVYLSLWASQNQHTEISSEVSIICVEEPEAYLHPHQQRELAEYLGKSLSGQVLLTSHSPFIVSEFSPNSIIRLYKKRTSETLVASDGCSKVLADNFDDFGYRMSVIPAEAFFSDCAILVEGPSELIFYKTLAKQLNIDLDRLNISVLNVEGVGFDTYINIINSLDIYWILRTDNDIMKIPYKDTYRMAGMERALDFLSYRLLTPKEEIIINENKDGIHGFKYKDKIPEEVNVNFKKLTNIIEDHDIYLAKVGLEEDLCNSAINSDLKDYYGVELIDADIIAKMKEHKAINMYSFLKKKKTCLSKLAKDEIVKPLISAKKYIESQYGTYGSSEENN